MSEVANHSEEAKPEVQVDAETEALYNSYGIVPAKTAQDIELPNVKEPNEPPTIEDEEDDHSEPVNSTDKRTIKVKYLGEDKDVSEDEAPEWIQKGMNHDRLQNKLAEQQKALDEVAQLQGFKDHTELLSQLPKLREQQKQQKENEFLTIRQELLQEAEQAGLDPDKLQEYLDNHPVMQEANRILGTQKVSEAKMFENQILSKWDEMYKLLPEGAAKPPLSFKDGVLHFDSAERPAWYTDDIQQKIERGYDPVDAYELANKGTIRAQDKKQAEQRAIKEQQLGLRSQVQGNGASEPDQNDLLPAQVALAELYGISTDGVKAQQKMINNRR